MSPGRGIKILDNNGFVVRTRYEELGVSVGSLPDFDLVIFGRESCEEFVVGANVLDEILPRLFVLKAIQDRIQCGMLFVHQQYSNDTAGRRFFERDLSKLPC